MTKEDLLSKNYVLHLIDSILEHIGKDENIIKHSDIEEIENTITSNSEKKLVDSILYKLQLVNDQMESILSLNKSYRIMHDFANLCSKTLDEKTLLVNAYQMVSRVMPTDAFYISLFEEETEEIDYLIMIENHVTYPNIKVKLGDSYTSKVIKQRDIIHLQKGTELNGNPNETFGIGDTKSCLFVPIIIDDKVRGVISAQSFKSFAYKKEHEELIQIIGSQVMNSLFTARLYKKTYQHSRIDEMTQIGNYRAFHEDLEQMIYSKEAFSIIMLDSDDLKTINDKFGHDFGDEYLISVAEGMLSVCSKDINVYRYAGDEFMIIVKDPNPQTAIDVFNCLTNHYRKTPILFNNERIVISISTGIAHYPTNGDTMESIKKAVDNALYKAKNSGKNQMVHA